jgi:hypothetical protein
MASLYDVSAEAQNDLFEIWMRIAEDSIDWLIELIFNFTSYLRR